ncbi:aminotransferase class I/II-fold pyridoxal phosphate-dependent enzyme [Paenibacillus sp. S-38]|uniref:aminotransferase class I/II-fold pyridoxal phosphate-dependent enzyme n=1 Tax=Paenibacillus sp. S-38 TaxID=3416710 RepID=UPI003CFB71D7
MQPNLQLGAPLLEKLTAHQRSGARSFHVPGHKSGAGLDPAAVDYYKDVLSLDLTEIPGLDDLHHPEEAIQEAQRLAAECFGAEETFFLIGGSTVGNMAMIAASCRKGDLLLVQRDAHKSVLHGLMLAGARAVFLTPLWDEETGLSHGVHPDTVEAALERYPEAKGLLITNPSYYGVSRDLTPLAELLHEQGKLLLVDEAHGAHFGFHEQVPSSALAAGADAVVQSSHKMLTAMTMGAMLHLQGSRIRRDAVRRALAMLQSSSPSYPILGSLDWTRRLMAVSGRERIEAVLQAAGQFSTYLKSQERWTVSRANPALGGHQDPLKLVLSDSTGSLGGFQLKELLEGRGVYAELADPRHVLLALGLGTTQEDITALITALKNIAVEEHESGRPPIGQPIPERTEWDVVSEPISLDWENALHGDKAHLIIPLSACAGYRVAQMIVPYPPGIPFLYPGERITIEQQTYLVELARVGCRFHGHDVAATGTVPVWDE